MKKITPKMATIHYRSDDFLPMCERFGWLAVLSSETNSKHYTQTSLNMLIG